MRAFGPVQHRSSRHPHAAGAKRGLVGFQIASMIPRAREQSSPIPNLHRKPPGSLRLGAPYPARHATMLQDESERADTTSTHCRVTLCLRRSRCAIRATMPCLMCSACAPHAPVTGVSAGGMEKGLPMPWRAEIGLPTPQRSIALAPRHPPHVRRHIPMLRMTQRQAII